MVKLIKRGTPFSFVFAIYRLLSSNQLREQFISDLEKLFIEYPFALLKHMGFDEDWKYILIEQTKINWCI